jgi:hypothetical protein
MYNIDFNKIQFQIDEINKNKEKIIDKENNLLKGQLFIKQKTFEIKTDDTMELNNLFYLHTPQYTLYSQSVVFDKNQKTIAHIKEVFTLFNKKYKVYDEFGKLLYIIKGNLSRFKIYEDKKHIGDIMPNTSSKSLKDKTSNKSFSINIFEGYEKENFYVLFAALLHIDITYIKKSFKRVILKRILGYSFLLLLIVFISLSVYRAHYIFSLDDDLVLDQNISIDDKVDIYPIEEDPNLEFDKEFLYDVKEIYSKSIYNNFNALKLFENNTTMIDEKKDFYRVLEKYIKTDYIFTFKEEGLFFRPVVDNPLQYTLSSNFNLDYFFMSLIIYIEYLDQKSYKKLADKLLKKLIVDLNKLIEKSYYFDYITAIRLYKDIFRTLSCNSKSRQLIFKDNLQFLRTNVKKRLYSTIIENKNKWITMINTAYKTASSKEKNYILRLIVASHKKGIERIIQNTFYMDNEERFIDLELYMWLIDSTNIVAFWINNHYSTLVLVNVTTEMTLRVQLRNEIEILKVIKLQKEFLENC